MEYARVSRRLTAAAIAGAILTGLSALPATAGYVVDLMEVGGNVVATGSGSIVPASPSSAFAEVATIIPSSGVIFTGLLPSGVLAVFEIPALGPTSFGTGPSVQADSASGDFVGIDGGDGSVVVPSDYVNGSPLSSTATWDNTTFSQLGVTPGTYTWQLGGAVGNVFTLNIGSTAATPEPSTWAMLLLGFAGLGWAGYRGRVAARTKERQEVRSAEAVVIAECGDQA